MPIEGVHEVRMKSFKPGAARALFLSATAFAVSFAVWGLVGALAPTFAGRDATGAYTWGFIFLAIFVLGCLAVNYFVFVKPCRPMRVATAMI